MNAARSAKVYVEVDVRFLKDGGMRPIALVWEDGHRYEIDRLLEDGYISMSETGHGKRKNYNARITLTESGKALAKMILEEAMQIQRRASQGISDEELAVFYVTLRKFHDNIKLVAKEREPDSRQQINA